jgi:hypothetical protein
MIGVLRVAGRIVYWLVVIVISVALLVVLVLFFESRDDSDVGAWRSVPQVA